MSSFVYLFIYFYVLSSFLGRHTNATAPELGNKQKLIRRRWRLANESTNSKERR
jgi:hypothetical protein